MERKIEIILKARQDFENKNLDYEEISKLYQDYNKLRNIKKFVARAKKMFPHLNCGLASVYLQNKIGGKIINGKYKNKNHTFLIIGKTLVDITFDQYGGPRVFFGPIKYPWSKR